LNFEDFKTYKALSAEAANVLSRVIYEKITEYTVLQDVVSEVATLRIANRDIVIPGIKRAWNEGIIQGAVTGFKKKVQKNIMPVQFAKADDIVIEPLYRPAIFNMNDFTITWSGLTPPTKIDLLDPGGTGGAYNLQVDKEMIILTDIICLDASPAVFEIQATVDDEVQKVVVPRKDWLATDLHIFEFPYPLVADINIRLQGRVESASGSITYLPIGLHICLGSIFKGLP
jgi:hypothetical protein